MNFLVGIHGRSMGHVGNCSKFETLKNRWLEDSYHDGEASDDDGHLMTGDEAGWN